MQTRVRTYRKTIRITDIHTLTYTCTHMGIHIQTWKHKYRNSDMQKKTNKEKNINKSERE